MVIACNEMLLGLKPQTFHKVYEVLNFCITFVFFIITRMHDK
ncbi:unnamed protein product [Brugia timori]|uniref:Uncharacterized protein n=1 Tax=Brugia timori TaxID=42155 RepID=A0A0R3Q831_9BILA|nr:unnamed protein product [Brugia timori]